MCVYGGGGVQIHRTMDVFSILEGEGLNYKTKLCWNYKYFEILYFIYFMGSDLRFLIF